MRLLVLSFVFALLSACVSPPVADPLLRATREGPVHGTRADGGITFYGVPYARAPVGALRWKPPQPPEKRSGVFEATSHGPACMQRALPDLPMSEDCLSLTISIPGNATAEARLPVYVWIHGGGFISGSNRNALGPVFNSRGVILVSINYRLGPLGFFTHPLLDEEAGVQQPANLALLDMQAALRWVKANIAGFGGDPDHIVIGGVSAGAQAVSLLLVTPGTEGLIRGAIVQSGYILWPALEREAGDGEDAYAEADRLARIASGGRPPDGAEDLRALPAAGFIDGVTGFQRPVIDGVTLLDAPAEAIRAGRYARIPVLTGAASFDGSVMPASGISEAELMSLIGPDSEAVRAAYAADFERDPAIGVKRIFGDVRYMMSGLFLARSLARRGDPAWLYILDYKPPSAPPDYPGSPHGAETALITAAGQGPAQGPGDEMLAYWVAFIRTLDPNVPGLAQWPRAAGENVPVMRFREGAEPSGLLPHPRFSLLARVMGLD